MSAYLQHSINCKGRIFELDKPVVMGILNATPDSFFDGGRYDASDAALSQVSQMLEQGAAIIDIGGYSSRPGAQHIDEKEELSRTLPLIEQIMDKFPEAILSIDTFRASVAKAAVEAGASIVNDISAGDDDPVMLETVARLQVPIVIMHKKGSPENMQDNPQYEDVSKEVFDYLLEKKNTCLKAGIKDVIVDPGFGFGKTVDHNYQLLQDLEHLAITDAPILVGFSRKSMINKVLGTTPQTALNGTTVLNTLALQKGASIIRVHDVKEAVEATKLYMQMEHPDLG